MKTRTTSAIATLATAAVVTGAGAARAQEPQVHHLRRMAVQAASEGAGGDRTVRFAWSSEAFGGKTVKGAPYSATAVTEVDQALGDGNRIRQKTSSQVARDREGRTRRELALAAVGPLAVGGGEAAPKMVLLDDPVAGASYSLDPERKTAHKMIRPEAAAIAPASGPAVAGEERRLELSGGDHMFHLPAPAPGAGGAVPLIMPHIVHHAIGAGGAVKRLPKPRTEDLGTQVIEGVRVQGTRSTTTIPAGEIGNERPLVTVTERWFSPELGAVVMSRHSDPRLGTTTYRLTDLRRVDPDPAQFQVPAGYTVKEDTARVFHHKMLKAK